MIRHCVFIRFRDTITAADRAEIFDGITALKQRIPGFLAVHIGVNVSPETGMDKGYSDGFMVDFMDAGARDAYLADPEHQKAGGRIVAAALGGLEGILVYDLELPG
jgi:hypothetical protein